MSRPFAIKGGWPPKIKLPFGGKNGSPIRGRLPFADPTYGTGGNPVAYASYPAPSGYRWDFVTDGGAIVTDGGIPVVDLVGA